MRDALGPEETTPNATGHAGADEDAATATIHLPAAKDTTGHSPVRASRRVRDRRPVPGGAGVRVAGQSFTRASRRIQPMPSAALSVATAR
ncbi:hypothetical protein GCM10010151_71250 [Actinoallomurus spadix]|uniref:Uncharacterized protein n=1 Tax=Actinoallomurus spadix TaxID=79912 RepID=A0ABN0XRL7_9ACTN